jgi:phage major head subunit gpT-like protein
MGVAFSTRFQNALKGATSMYPKIATEVPSGTREMDYGWLNDMPGVREWIGDRKVRELSASSYTIKNKDWEITIGVDRNDVEDDNLGVYSMKIDVMADSTQRHYDELSFGLLKDGFSTECYDGQYFFDTDHPVLDADGNETTFANTDGGSGNAWFLAATGAPLKPIILQKRRDYQFVSKDAPNDDGVFFQKKFLYGADARYNVGFGLPQLCWGSKQTLDATHFNTAYDGLFAMPRDGGGKIAPTAFTLCVGPSNRAAAEAVIGAEFLAGGATNVNYKKADLLVVPWLD